MVFGILVHKEKEADPEAIMVQAEKLSAQAEKLYAQTESLTHEIERLRNEIDKLTALRQPGKKTAGVPQSSQPPQKPPPAEPEKAKEHDKRYQVETVGRK
jgi:hypothetical protein